MATAKARLPSPRQGPFALSRATVRGPLESAAQAFNVRPRVGWAIPLNDDFTLWTRGSVGLGASKTSYDSTGADGLSAKRSATLAQWRVSLGVSGGISLVL